MAASFKIVVGVLALTVYIQAAPNQMSNLEEFIKISDEEMKISDSGITNDKTNARQKRWHNIYGYGSPPGNPFIYTNNVKRDESRDTGVYGFEDPYTHIHKRLQEISSVIRQPVFSPPPPPQYPIFFPIIYLPQIAGCNCAPAPGNNVPTDNRNPSTPTGNKNQTSPDIHNRFPDMEDPRQNWGIVVNDSVKDDSNDEDFSRPISFAPILPSRPISRPPPPVEHGSSQADINAQNTVNSEPPVVNSEPPVEIQSDLETDLVLTSCDTATITCCHRNPVSYECFAQENCPEATSYGDPCAANVILKIVNKYRKFYEKKNS